ncbi:hypothetical protein EVAR_2766_1 [Eumeta japonica]|uniref:Uncharacterized protein n=1 Tax=Eumeta variegata TaxID=151549 RepID=A0A4C1SZK8_EUMVA|nr:hypothetical protein EVAR_2766_1 [Eumeta japonica]
MAQWLSVLPSNQKVAEFDSDLARIDQRYWKKRLKQSRQRGKYEKDKYKIEGDDTVNERKAQRRFNHFNSGDLTLADHSCSGCPPGWNIAISVINRRGGRQDVRQVGPSFRYGNSARISHQLPRKHALTRLTNGKGCELAHSTRSRRRHPVLSRDPQPSRPPRRSTAGSGGHERASSPDAGVIIMRTGSRPAPRSAPA